MADYSHHPGGSLKLKGGVADGGIKKKYDSYAFYDVHLLEYQPITQEEEIVQIPREGKERGTRKEGPGQGA